jgi:hypothetical protein
MIKEYVILTGYLYSLSMAIFLFLTWIICAANDGRLIITIGSERTIELMILSCMTSVSFYGLAIVINRFIHSKL